MFVKMKTKFTDIFVFNKKNLKGMSFRNVLENRLPDNEFFC